MGCVPKLYLGLWCVNLRKTSIESIYTGSFSQACINESYGFSVVLELKTPERSTYISCTGGEAVDMFYDGLFGNQKLLLIMVFDLLAIVILYRKLAQT